MASTDLKVAVERAIHDALRDAIQHISDEHGIQVQSVSVDWLGVSTLDKSRFVVRGLQTSTMSRHG